MDRIAPYELPLPAQADSVAVARRYFTAIALDEGLPAKVRDVGALVVSELVTNAVTHGRDPITLRVTPLPRTVRVAVSDGSDALPAARRRPKERPIASDARSANHGRGLAIVERIADQWGCEPAVQQSGKTVWCNLAIAPDAAA